jgi:hypothetical protein
VNFHLIDFLKEFRFSQFTGKYFFKIWMLNIRWILVLQNLAYDFFGTNIQATKKGQTHLV